MIKILDKEYENLYTSFYVSMPVNIRGYWVFTILQLNKEAVKSIPTLNTSTIFGGNSTIPVKSSKISVGKRNKS
jgi:hypothetical protein